MMCSRLTERPTSFMARSDEHIDTAAAGRQKVLLLAADPSLVVNLGFTRWFYEFWGGFTRWFRRSRHFDREFRKIRRCIVGAVGRDRFDVVDAVAVQPDDLIDQLDHHEPHIVHFCGFGSGDGGILLVAANGSPCPVPPEALGRVFKTCQANVSLVVLSACYAAAQANAIAQHVDCVIAMTGSAATRAGAEAALTFTSQLYSAIANGKDFEAAFERGDLLQHLHGQPSSFVLFKEGKQVQEPRPHDPPPRFVLRRMMKFVAVAVAAGIIVVALSSASPFEPDASPTDSAMPPPDGDAKTPTRGFVIRIHIPGTTAVYFRCPEPQHHCKPLSSKGDASLQATEGVDSDDGDRDDNVRDGAARGHPAFSCNVPEWIIDKSDCALYATINNQARRLNRWNLDQCSSNRPFQCYFYPRDVHQ